MTCIFKRHVSLFLNCHYYIYFKDRIELISNLSSTTHFYSYMVEVRNFSVIIPCMLLCFFIVYKIIVQFFEGKSIITPFNNKIIICKLLHYICITIMKSYFLLYLYSVFFRHIYFVVCS